MRPEEQEGEKEEEVEEEENGYQGSENGVEEKEEEEVMVNPVFEDGVSEGGEGETAMMMME